MTGEGHAVGELVARFNARAARFPGGRTLRFSNEAGGHATKRALCPSLHGKELPEMPILFRGALGRNGFLL
jgi:hypothetical protein